jgi:hypothetical protein
VKALFVAALCVFASFFLLGCTDKEIGEMIMSDLQKQQAVNSGDPTKCTELDKSDVNGCYSQIAANKKDLSICLRIESPALLLLCKSDVAVAKGDPSICADLNDDEVLDSCYSQIAEAKKDVALCDKVRREENKVGCLSALALSKNDASICSKIYSMRPYDGDLCYSKLAEQNGDASMCEKVAGVGRDYCFERVAAGEKDERICERIINREEKDICIKGVAGASSVK